ncbi:MAG: TRAP transporter large permease [Roseomonas sp.]|jgi:C4-dicarboxylate transporter DctM subunit|nr:TRAP transporter large permease [Roseomonas sp.]MCZ8143236.1 TRAP transporter large permease [Acetobacteraceae bacterium]MCA3409073.1 TRAP transporter large permease [Roseomonas sp.]MCA3418704.1 TRAP transporter large permease [Roseomonas sp.]MCA3424467.1 TRAP transporter large permease [Roseomonas sp.]
MIGVTEATIGFLLLIGFLFLGLHVAVAMFLIALLGAALYLGPPLVAAFGTQLWGAMEDYVLLSIPLYILLGEILVRSGSTDRLYRSLADWLNILPGGLLHTNIGASAVFSAVSGSSVATAATISTVALPSFRKRRYDTRLVLGSIAAGASLGNLIPPGIALIVYGAMTNTSVGQLYAAAVIPGIVMTVLFMGTIIMIALLKPDLVRQKEVADPLRERLKRLVDLMPPLVIFGIIMGSIYTGWATVTESAALAVVVALPIAALYGRLSIRMLHECFIATANLTAMSLLILAVAFYLNFVMGLLGVTSALGAFATSIGASPLELIIALTIFYLLLGIFFETLPMLVGTVPVVFPVIVAAGIDPVWFGVFIVLMCEISLISPPVGMTLYVIQAVRREGTIAEVFQGTIPFFIAMVVMTALLIGFPEMALWLPRISFGP